MSDVKTLFGLGGGASTFIGGHVQGNSGAPDLVTDGITVYVKTGVQIPTSIYPLAPSVYVSAGSRWLSSNPIPAALANAAVSNYQFVSVGNGANRIVYPQFDSTAYTATQYFLSTDGGATLAPANLPGSSGTLNIRDICAGGGFFFMLLRTTSDSTTRVYRSADGTAGSWTLIYSFADSNQFWNGISFGNGKLFISGAPFGQLNIVGSLNPTAVTPTFTNYGSVGGAPGQGYGIAKIRFGKPAGAADIDKFFVIGGASGSGFISATATPENPSSFLRTATGFFDYTNEIFTGISVIQGAGNVWVIRPSAYAAYLSTNLGAVGGAPAVTLTGANGNPIFVCYDSGLYVMGLSNVGSATQLQVFGPTGALITNNTPAPLLNTQAALGASVSDGNIYLYPATGTVTARAQAAGDYTATDKALYGPAYNAAGAFQADSRLFMRVA